MDMRRKTSREISIATGGGSPGCDTDLPARFFRLEYQSKIILAEVNEKNHA